MEYVRPQLPCRVCHVYNVRIERILSQVIRSHLWILDHGFRPCEATVDALMESGYLFKRGHGFMAADTEKW